MSSAAAAAAETKTADDLDVGSADVRARALRFAAQAWGGPASLKDVRRFALSYGEKCENGVVQTPTALDADTVDNAVRFNAMNILKHAARGNDRDVIAYVRDLALTITEENFTKTSQGYIALLEALRGGRVELAKRLCEDKYTLKSAAFRIACVECTSDIVLAVVDEMSTVTIQCGVQDALKAGRLDMAYALCQRISGKLTSEGIDNILTYCGACQGDVKGKEIVAHLHAAKIRRLCDAPRAECATPGDE